MYDLSINENVYNDLLISPDFVIKEVEAYFLRLREDPYACSLPLYGNLSTCRKVYIADATYRIVIQIENNIAKIVEVVAVGKREEKQVYQEASKRIKKEK